MGSSVRDGPVLQEAVVAWFYLLCAGLLEVVWAFYMKQSAGFTRLTPTLNHRGVAMVASVALLSISLRSLRWAPPIRSGPALARSAPSWWHSGAGRGGESAAHPGRRADRQRTGADEADLVLSALP